MSRLWLTGLGLLCLFVITCASRDDDHSKDIPNRLRMMQLHWKTMDKNGRVWQMMNFKMWVSSNVHFRFVFSGSRLRDLEFHLSALMAANEGNMEEAMKELLRKLEKSGAPKEDVERFLKGLKKRCQTTGTALTPTYPPKTLFIIPTPTADYNGALSECHAKGGSLAVIANAAEAHTAWKLVSSHKVPFYVMAKSLPEHFRRMYPQLLGNEMDSTPGPNFKCLTMEPKIPNRFHIESCSAKRAAMCEKYDLETSVKAIGVKGIVYYKDRSSLQHAKETCASIGGSLATINNLLEQHEAFDHLSFHGNLNAFIGALKDNDNGWLWRGGRSMAYKNWGPFPQTPGDRCAVMERKDSRRRTSGTWRPVACSSRNAFLCEVRVIPDIFVRLVDRNAVGKYFVGHSDRKTHGEARSECGQLAKIRNEEQLAAAMLAARRIGRVHIGLRDSMRPGVFKWDDDSEVAQEMLEKRMVGFTARNKDHRCVVMDAHGRWLSASCDEKAGYLCEEPYQKKPTKKDYIHTTFTMDVRFDVSYSEVTRTTQLKESFIRAAEAPIVKVIRGKANDVIVSSLKPGSTIVRYHFYTPEMRETFKLVKDAVEEGRVSAYFNGRYIRVTKEQDYNYNQHLYICGPFETRSRTKLIAGVSVGVIVFIAVFILILVCCIKKRKILTARVASTVDMKGDEPEKKGPPPDDEPLPPYKEAIATTGDEPPPYCLPVATPPPPYNTEMPEVKT